MQKHLENIINIYPALKEVCSKLENVNFTPYNIIHKSKCTKILAKKEDEHLHDLDMKIDYVTNCATITIKTRLIWAEHAKLSLPGYNIQLEIDGESDYNYNYDHSFILRATKTETDVKLENLVETIDSMLNEIQAAHKDLTKL
jgi:hypothetical protein